MAKLVYLFIASVLAIQGLCGHQKHEVAAATGKPAPILLDPQVPTTRPIAVNESSQTKTCPDGFDWLGKQCVKTLNAQPDFFCPSGYSKGQSKGGQCAKYVGQQTKCPDGYDRSSGLCVRSQESVQEEFCPEDYAFTADGQQCVTTVELPNVFYCPAGTARKGEVCVRENQAPPQLYCPPGYTLEGKRCFIEETYDCTPVDQEVVSDAEGHKHHKHLRMLGHSSGNKHSSYVPSAITRPSKPVNPPTVTDRVIVKTCKRTRTEDARKVCPNGGLVEGKGCVYEEESPLLQKPGGFKEEFAPVIKQCPVGYGLVRGTCVSKTEVLPQFFCPYGTENLGNKCASYKAALPVCPDGFKLDGDGRNCSKSLVTAPIVEYTITYKCKGKDCADPAPASSHHKHH